MKKLLNLLSIIFCSLLWNGCQKNDDPIVPPKSPVLPLPTISSFSPASGIAGATVIISGSNFSAIADSNSVKFNETASVVLAATATSVTVTVPAGAATGKITLQVGTGVATSITDFILLTTAGLTVSTLAGNGVFGFADGAGNTAKFFQPIGVVFDAAGNLFVTDAENHRIRKVTPSGNVSTFAGSGTAGFADGAGTNAKFNSPRGITIDAVGNLYVADGINHNIRKITIAGVVTTLAGSGIAGFADGVGAAAQFHFPKEIKADAAGNLYVADDINHRIRKVTPTGTVSTIAGSVLGSADGQGATATFNQPTGIAVDAAGNLFIADAKNHRIRKITSAGVVSSLAGSGVEGSADGDGIAAQFNTPTGIAVDNLGNIFVAEDGNIIRKITATGTVTTLAGSASGFNDGTAAAAKFNTPSGLAVDASGKIYVADRLNHRIRKIE